MSSLLPDGPMFAFGYYLNTSYMRKAWTTLQSYLFPRPVNITACKVNYARCRTYLSPSSWDKSFLGVCYELNHEEEIVESHKTIVYGKAYLNGGSHSKYQELVNSSHKISNSGQPQLMPELDMIFWVFPEDPVLSQLTGLLNPEYIITCLPYTMLPFASREEIFDIKVKVIRYRPEQRCILRYTICYGMEKNEYVLYAKIFEDNKAERVFSFMEHFESSLNNYGFHIPQSLAHDANRHIVWQKELPGQPLTEIEGVEHKKQILADIGRILASFHTISLPMHQCITREEKLVEMDKKIKKLSQAFPAFSGDLGRVSQRAHSELVSLPLFRQTVIHGDMHFGQFLVMHDGKLALLDFDGCCYGEPAQDLADFIVDPHLGEFERAGDVHNQILTAESVSILLTNYRRNGTYAVDDIVIIWHARIQLINKAYRAAITQEPYWQNKIPELIALAINDDFLAELIYE